MLLRFCHPLNVRSRFLVAYDIRDDRRLRAVHDVVLDFGRMLQYSVYVCDLDAMEKEHLLAALHDVANLREDSIVLVNLGPAEGRGEDCFEFMGARRKLPPVNKARIY